MLIYSKYLSYDNRQAICQKNSTYNLKKIKIEEQQYLRWEK